MAKLSDLVNVNINRDTIKIQGATIPVVFTFRTFPYVEEAYGKPYHVFENDINRMMRKKEITIGKNEIKLMNSLVYGMVKSAGTDCTPYEIENAIPVSELPDIFQTAINIFNNQNFQKSDMDKIKTEKKN